MALPFGKVARYDVDVHVNTFTAIYHTHIIIARSNLNMISSGLVQFVVYCKKVSSLGLKSRSCLQCQSCL